MKQKMSGVALCLVLPGNYLIAVNTTPADGHTNYHRMGLSSSFTKEMKKFKKRDYFARYFSSGQSIKQEIQCY